MSCIGTRTKLALIHVVDTGLNNERSYKRNSTISLHTKLKHFTMVIKHNQILLIVQSGKSKRTWRQGVPIILIRDTYCSFRQALHVYPFRLSSYLEQPLHTKSLHVWQVCRRLKITPNVRQHRIQQFSLNFCCLVRSSVLDSSSWMSSSILLKTKHTFRIIHGFSFHKIFYQTSSTIFLSSYRLEKFINISWTSLTSQVFTEIINKENIKTSLKQYYYFILLETVLSW